MARKGGGVRPERRLDVDRRPQLAAGALLRLLAEPRSERRQRAQGLARQVGEPPPLPPRPLADLAEPAHKGRAEARRLL
eukprot:5411649-Prymnesium_polylepis.1